MAGSAVPVGSGGAAAGAASVGVRRAALTTLLMSLASIVERADEGILPAVSVEGDEGGQVHHLVPCMLPLGVVRTAMPAVAAR